MLKLTLRWNWLNFVRWNGQPRGSVDKVCNLNENVSLACTIICLWINILKLNALHLNRLQHMLLESFPALRNQNTIVSSSRALPKPCTVGNVIASVRNLINYYSCLTLLATAAALSSASCRHSAQPQAALEAVMKPKFQVEPTTISSFSLQE